MKPRSLKYWALAGLLVPALFLLINSIVDQSALGPKWQYVVSTLWPSSFFFMALHGDYGNGISASTVFIYVISIGINVILYSVTGATLWLFISKWVNEGGKSGSPSTVKLVSIICSIYAIGSFFGVPLFLGIVYGPAFLELLDASYHVNILPIAGIGNAIFSGLIAYSFWQLRHWGRHLAIIYNAIWLALVLLGFAVSQVIVPPSADPIGLKLLLSLVFLAFPAAIILFCLRPDVKELMGEKFKPVEPEGIGA